LVAAPRAQAAVGTAAATTDDSYGTQQWATGDWGGGRNTLRNKGVVLDFRLTRPPSVEEREQHVAPLDRHLTKANSRLVRTNCRCAVSKIFFPLWASSPGNGMRRTAVVEARSTVDAY